MAEFLDQGTKGAGAGMMAGHGRRMEFRFYGTALEYFGIWIVNLFLSIITIGIYTAWAKVRRLRYFYGNTELDGHRFEYHARPMQILIGRIIVVALLLAYNLLVTLSPLFSILLVPYLLGLPWIINRAMRFNARVTSYRNVRFNFRGSYGGALVVFVLMPIVSLLSLGLLHPITTRMVSNYTGRNTSWGSAQFMTQVGTGSVYKAYGLSFIFFILLFAGGTLAAWQMLNAVDLSFIGRWLELLGEEGAEDADPRMVGTIFTSIMLFYAVLVLAWLHYRAQVRNIAFNASVMNHARSDGGEDVFRLHSSLSAMKYVWILVSNLFVILATAGLMRAWAAIRTWRYLAANSALSGDGDLGRISQEMEQEGAAASAEYLDIEGIDFGL